MGEVEPWTLGQALATQMEMQVQSSVGTTVAPSAEAIVGIHGEARCRAGIHTSRQKPMSNSPSSTQPPLSSSKGKPLHCRTGTRYLRMRALFRTASRWQCRSAYSSDSWASCCDRVKNAAGDETRRPRGSGPQNTLAPPQPRWCPGRDGHGPSSRPLARPAYVILVKHGQPANVKPVRHSLRHRERLKGRKLPR